MWGVDLNDRNAAGDSSILDKNDAFIMDIVTKEKTFFHNNLVVMRLELLPLQEYDLGC